MLILSYREKRREYDTYPGTSDEQQYIQILRSHRKINNCRDTKTDKKIGKNR